VTTSSHALAKKMHEVLMVLMVLMVLKVLELHEVYEVHKTATTHHFDDEWHGDHYPFAQHHDRATFQHPEKTARPEPLRPDNTTRAAPPAAVKPAPYQFRSRRCSPHLERSHGMPLNCRQGQIHHTHHRAHRPATPSDTADRSSLRQDCC
jgi:hypothetical protein